MSEVIVVRSAWGSLPTLSGRAPVAGQSRHGRDFQSFDGCFPGAESLDNVLGLVIAATGLAPAPASQAAEAATCPVPSGMIYNLPKNTVGQGEITPDDQFRWHRTMQCMFEPHPRVPRS